MGNNDAFKYFCSGSVLMVCYELMDSSIYYLWLFILFLDFFKLFFTNDICSCILEHTNNKLQSFLDLNKITDPVAKYIYPISLMDLETFGDYDFDRCLSCKQRKGNKLLFRRSQFIKTNN